ncbi:MAG: YcjX family protein [Alphaproteobacteria bacterium]|nr:YcjX family protein [Alphaproteobacteria bacterium]
MSSATEVLAALLPLRRTVRIGVTGLAKAGKTALLTSLAANLLAAGAGLATLPALGARLGPRRLRVGLAPAGADALPRFDYAAHLAALAADPPRWPARTNAVSLLALDLEVTRAAPLALVLPPHRLRLEVLDYPGEWLLDLPLLGQGFAAWSAAVLRRLEGRPAAAPFLGFLHALPARAGRDEALAASGHTLYRQALEGLRAEGLALLQPGRFLMPPPGPAPPWLGFFPMTGGGGLAALLEERYEQYRAAVRRELSAPGFAGIDRLVVLADVLAALHAGPAAFADAAAALGEVARALDGQQRPAWLPAFLAGLLPFLGGIERVAFVASKADHVAERQRGNLAALVNRLAATPRATTATFAIAAVRCTEDIVWTLEGHPVSAVRGRVAGEARAGRSYPGEVPDRTPDAAFWAHRFLALPDFEPMVLPLGGRGGVPHIGLDLLLDFLLGDLL